VKTIFKGLNWEKSFKVQFTPPLELSLKRFQSPQPPQPPWTLQLETLQIQVHCAQGPSFSPPQSSSSPNQSTQHVHNSCDQIKNIYNRNVQN